MIDIIKRRIPIASPPLPPPISPPSLSLSLSLSRSLSLSLSIYLNPRSLLAPSTIMHALTFKIFHILCFFQINNSTEMKEVIQKKKYQTHRISIYNNATRLSRMLTTFSARYTQCAESSRSYITFTTKQWRCFRWPCLSCVFGMLLSLLLGQHYLLANSSLYCVLGKIKGRIKAKTDKIVATDPYVDTSITQ